MSGYGKIYESSYWGVGVCDNTIGWGSSYKSIANCTDASFSYPLDSYPTNGLNPTPTITGDAGGTFTATPSGLTLNASTGEITLSTSSINSYTIRYTLPDTTYAEQTVGITAPAFASTQSFSFDGVDDYFDLGTGLDIFRYNINESYSVGVWYKSTTSTSFDTILNFASNTYKFSLVTGLNGTISFGAGSSTLITYINKWLPTSGAINDGNWHHICIIQDSSGGSVNLTPYVDGSPSGSSPSGTAAFVSSNNRIGNGYYSGLEGSLDEVAIWNSALSSAAVTEVYNSGVPNDLDSLSNASSPTAWYRMGE